MDPKINPEFLIAVGIANIPEPREDFNKWTSEPKSLKNKRTY